MQICIVVSARGMLVFYINILSGIGTVSDFQSVTSKPFFSCHVINFHCLELFKQNEFHATKLENVCVINLSEMIEAILVLLIRLKRQTRPYYLHQLVILITS